VDAEVQLLREPRFGANRVQFQPFLTTDVSFVIDRPSTRGAVREQRADASPVLRGAMKDTLSMTVPDFGLLFDALHRDTAALFTGRIDIAIPNEDTEQVPFRARLDDLAGELFTYATSSPSQGSLRLTLTNAIESALRVDTLDLGLRQGDRRTQAFIVGSPLPIERLEPGQSVVLEVEPRPALEGSDPAEISVDLEGVTALPDLEAIWEAIIDRSSVEYFMTVTVKASPSLFEPVAGRDGDRIVLVSAELEGGGTAQLSASQLEAKVRVDHAIDDVILRRPIDGSYRYTLTIVRANGHQERDAEPREHSAPELWIAVNK
jgi:hypothetical protein